MWEKYKEITVEKGNAILRQRAINNYYKNPVICRHCGSILKIKVGQSVAEARRKSFCNQSCGASFNNKGIRRHGYEANTKCSCGSKKSFGSSFCQSCKKLNTWEKHKLCTLEEISGKGNARVKWSSLRGWAKLILKLVQRKRICIFCNHTCVLDVAHIKSISSFKENVLCGEVNHPDNLAYMCPTHHKMFDKGYIDINGKELKNKC